MNSSFTSAIARALPPASRQSQFRASPLHIMRSFSSSPSIRANDKGQAREIERNILGANRGSGAKSDEDNPFNVLGKIVGNRRTPQSPTPDYTRMAESLESEVMKHAYADRAPPHHLHVFSHRRNTHITLTRPNGEPIMCLSCGNLGFQKAARGGYDPAYQLTNYFFTKIHEKGLLLDIQRLELIFRDFGPGRDAFVRVLLGQEGRAIRGLISRVTDATRIKFGGTRSRHVRRLG